MRPWHGSCFTRRVHQVFVKMFSSLLSLFFFLKVGDGFKSANVVRIVGKWPTSTVIGSSLKKHPNRSLQSVPSSYFKLKSSSQSVSVRASNLSSAAASLSPDNLRQALEPLASLSAKNFLSDSGKKPALHCQH